MTLQAILPIVRHGLQFLAGYLTARGLFVFDAVMTEAFIGIGLGLFSIAWFEVEKRIRRKEAEEALDEFTGGDL